MPSPSLVQALTGNNRLGDLGLAHFVQDFYLPEATTAWLVEKEGPLVRLRKEYSLAQAREDF